MSSKCNHCTNKKQCEECDKSWKDRFIPIEEVKEYFSRTYSGVGGFNGYSYHFDTTNDSLIDTHSIMINNKQHCPYCGETMYSIQDQKTLITKGYCCICQGARDEIEYKKKKKEIEEIYEKELNSLKIEYKDKLLFCSEKLFDIKQKKEREDFEFFKSSNKHYHFSTLNGNSFTKIEQLI
jgi:hypothetical protein